MKEEEFNSEIDRLTDIIQHGNISEKKKVELRKLREETKQQHKTLKDTMRQLQDSLDTLRLCIKYVLFDLEASRREIKYLKNLLNGDNNEKDDGQVA